MLAVSTFRQSADILLHDVAEANTTIAVQQYLDELALTDGSADASPIIRELISRSAHRLHILCSSLLSRSYRRLKAGPTNLETGELLGSVTARLMRAMAEVRPETVRQFFALANRHMRWELNDIARRLDGREVVFPLDSRVAAVDPSQAQRPSDGARLARILMAIEQLPEEEREAFSLVRIQGMTKAEAGAILGVSEKTVQRRLRRCLDALAESLADLIEPDAVRQTAEDVGLG